MRPGETCRVGAVLRLPTGHAPAEGLPVELALRAPDERVLKTWTRRTDVARDDRTRRALPAGRADGSVPRRRDRAGSGGAAGDACRSASSRSCPTGSSRPCACLPATSRFGDTVAVSSAASLLTGRPAPGLQARVRVRYAPDARRAGRTASASATRTRRPRRFAWTSPTCASTRRARRPSRLRLPAAERLGTSAARRLRARGRGRLRAGQLRAGDASCREHPRPRLGLAVPVDGSFDVPVVVEGAGEVAGHRGARAPALGGRLCPRARAALARLARRPGGPGGPGASVRARGRSRPRPLRRRGRRTVPRARPGRGPGGRLDALRPLGREDRALGRRRRRSAAGAPLVEEAVVPGSTATLQVDAPFAGRGLLTVEGPGVLEARVVDVRAGLQSFEVLVPDAPSPNVHATLTVLRGVREAGDGNARVLGAVRVPLARPERRLEVGLDLPARAVPGTDLRGAGPNLATRHRARPPGGRGRPASHGAPHARPPRLLRGAPAPRHAARRRLHRVARANALRRRRRRARRGRGGPGRAPRSHRAQDDRDGRPRVGAGDLRRRRAHPVRAARAVRGPAAGLRRRGGRGVDRRRLGVAGARGSDLRGGARAPRRGARRRVRGADPGARRGRRLGGDARRPGARLGNRSAVRSRRRPDGRGLRGRARHRRRGPRDDSVGRCSPSARPRRTWSGTRCGGSRPASWPTRTSRVPGCRVTAERASRSGRPGCSACCPPSTGCSSTRTAAWSRRPLARSRSSRSPSWPAPGTPRAPRRATPSRPASIASWGCRPPTAGWRPGPAGGRATRTAAPTRRTSSSRPGASADPYRIVRSPPSSTISRGGCGTAMSTPTPRACWRSADAR